MNEEREKDTGLGEEEFGALLQSIGRAAPLLKAVSQRETPQDPPANGDACARREALLCALKPYLSHERAVAVDYLLRLSRVGDAIKAMK